MKKILIFVLCLCFCSPLFAGEKKDFKKELTSYMKIPLQDAIAKAGLDKSTEQMVEDPPGKVRGIRAKNVEGQLVYLYVDKGRYNVAKKWTINDLMEKPVIGAAIKHNGEWITKGRVVHNYHWNKH